MEELRIFLNSLSSDEQRMFACECGTSIGYLRKALSKGQVLGHRYVSLLSEPVMVKLHVSN
ncbi:hypothetical protein ACNFZ3_12710 [Escherichia coli]